MCVLKTEVEKEGSIQRTLDLEVQEWEADVILNFYNKLNAWFGVIQMLEEMLNSVFGNNSTYVIYIFSKREAQHHRKPRLIPPHLP